MKNVTLVILGIAFGFLLGKVIPFNSSEVLIEAPKTELSLPGYPQVSILYGFDIERQDTNFILSKHFNNSGSKYVISTAYGSKEKLSTDLIQDYVNAQVSRSNSLYSSMVLNRNLQFINQMDSLFSPIDMLIGGSLKRGVTGAFTAANKQLTFKEGVAASGEKLCYLGGITYLYKDTTGATQLLNNISNNLFTYDFKFRLTPVTPAK